MNLRDYQERAIEAVFEQWKTVTSTCVVAATGLGKTILSANNWTLPERYKFLKETP